LFWTRNKQATRLWQLPKSATDHQIFAAKNKHKNQALSPGFYVDKKRVLVNYLMFFQGFYKFNCLMYNKFEINFQKKKGKTDVQIF
jgi:hypothetical protein